MLVDFSQVLLNIKGKPFQEVEDGKMAIITLRSLASGALQSVFREDSIAGFAAKEKLVDLLFKIHGQPVVELSEEEIKTLKDRISKINANPLMVVQAVRILEGTPLELKVIEE